ncbi:MAG: hypothetical protein GKS06_00685 [Acidobacteria bacterium]|nr:hypothetical protein [Acidobacteriota bacterium]
MKRAQVAAALLLAGSLSAGGQENMPAPMDATSASDRSASWARHVELRDESPFAGLPWLAVGPRFQGGRVEAIAVDPRDGATMYVGAGAGNLWKTENAGTTWQPIFDREGTFSIGDVTLAPSDPDVIWVGTGEVLMARSSYAGFGVYRSDDGGDSWRHLGLEDTHHIARVVVHPEDPDIAWVAAIGRLFSPNEQRGIFKTTNGGESWERTLYVDELTGAIDLIADPRDPDVMYAAMWEHSRRAWGHNAAGDGSGLYKTTDGGDTWVPLTNGFPNDEYVGRIGLAIAPSEPDTIYALVDNHVPVAPDENGRRPPRGQVYRSDDAGASWRLVTEQNIPAGYDFCLIRVLPDNADHVIIPGQVVWESTNGGRTFAEMSGEVVHLLEHGADVLHLDQHEMLINPDDADHWIMGNDGGVYVSYDRGANWLHLNNLPLAEFYAINLDMERPYQIFGGTQDDAALFGPSHVGIDAGPEDPWEHVYIDPWGGGDSYFTPPHPIDKHVVFYSHQFGALRRKDMRDGTTVDIMPRPDDFTLRVNWMTPFFLSAYDPDTIYYGGQVVLRSRNRGDDWEVVSPDLTAEPRPDRQGNIPFGTLTSMSESPVDSRVFWTGSDDGRVRVSRDGLQTWADASAGLPHKWVSRVVASMFDADRAYVSFTGYRDDDFTPYLFRTEDRGASWELITSNLPLEPINVVREDPTNPDLLYVGTDLGVYVSRNGGASWLGLMGDLPTTPVYDLRVHPRDPELVAGTHGRGAFVLNLEPVRGFDEAAGLQVFPVAPAVRPRGRQPAPYRYGTTPGEAVIRFSVPAGGVANVTILDPSGEPIRTMEVQARPGVNIARWDLLPDGVTAPYEAFARPAPYAVPGTYSVRLRMRDVSTEGSFEVLDG